ncbi:hypothetical protein VNO78_08513 [Psophocarpus tetragonolobus]|uniref:Uncharacterized protein n=1 Tax=Psophocarpus tetragonolobus TaxID=3891 RepID=A0AAN9T5D1_PSOTE
MFEGFSWGGIGVAVRLVQEVVCVGGATAGILGGNAIESQAYRLLKGGNNQRDMLPVDDVQLIDRLWKEKLSS